MEPSNSLLLNEESLKQCSDQKKPVFIYEWLRYLDRVLPAAQRSDIRGCQQRLIEQLTERMLAGPGPPTRVLLTKCIATVYCIGDAYAAPGIFQTINACNDALRSKDDSPSQLPIKLSALACLGALYERLGRMVGRTYEETTQLLIKWLKSAESQGRTEIMLTLSKMIVGLGAAGASIHRDLYKHIRQYVTDRVASVRVAAIHCLTALVPEYAFLYTTELENTVALSFKALESSNYETRQAVAQLLATLLSSAHSPPKSSTSGARSQQQTTTMTNTKITPIDDCLNLLAVGFLRGGISGFLKGSTGVMAGIPKEVRIGAYVELVREMGVEWLERNLVIFLKHLIDLVEKCGSLASSNQTVQYAEVVHMRRCISFVLRATLGRMLSEKAQITACKQLGALLAEHQNANDYNIDPTVERSLSMEICASAQAVICSLQELSCLVRQIGTAVTPLFVEASGIMEPVFASLLHPVLAARIAAAYCLRCVTDSVPAQLTPLIDRCLSRLEHMKVSPDAISGYSLALATLFAGSAQCMLGVPHAKSRQMFLVAEDMLRTASQTARLALVKTNCGWLLLTSIMTLVAKVYVPKMLIFWKNAFPRSMKEADAEKQRGDAFTWSVTLDARAGALAAMDQFCQSCPDLVTDDIIRKIVHPIELSLSMVSNSSVLLRSCGNQIRSLLVCVRLRIYTVLNHLAPKYYEHLFAVLLRELVADITLSDNVQSTLCTSLLASLCQGVDRSLLGTWLQDTDERMVEEELHPCHSGVCGALENDSICLLNRDDEMPEPLPIGVALIDTALIVYGRIFPHVPTKHKLQMTDHFAECIKSSTKQTVRQQSIQMNIFGALLTSFKSMGEQKAKMDGDALQKSSVALIVSCIAASNPLLRCAAAEALGRLSQAVSDPQFVAGMAQFSFDKLKTCRDAANRTGYALTLGCLHRYVGSLGSGQHLNTSVSILLALAQDNSSPVVQAWSIRALGLIADTGGGMFRGYVEPCLSLCMRLLLNTPFGNIEVAHCVGKLVSALITSVGPELQSVGAIESIRTSFLIACSMMLDHPDSIVKAESIACLQQLHLFAPRFVELDRLVNQLCILLNNKNLLLRKASVSCLRQLLQREAKEVREHAQTLVPQSIMLDRGKDAILTETGLEGALFAMLDIETDIILRQHIKEALTSLVQATAIEYLSYWLSICNDILASTSVDLRSPQSDEKMIGNSSSGGVQTGVDENDDDAGDDDQTLQQTIPGGSSDKQKLSPRWPTRVFTIGLVQKLMALCECERAHFDLALAKELQLSYGKSDYLVLHLSDLVRMSFMAATSDNNNLRLAGLSCLQDVINQFSTVPEPEFPGHVILEQFQAQVGAALRPAFATETPSHVTAAACQVCSTWIGSGVARDLNDLRRVHQLLVSSLSKLRHGSISTQLYSESAATLEKLAILKAWAEVYIMAIDQQEAAVTNTDNTINDVESESSSYVASECLLSLVRPELIGLVGHWLSALRDSALLSLPIEYSSQLPPDGGAYFTPESVEACKPYYRQSWPPILLASAIWLKQNCFDLPINCEMPKQYPNEKKEDRFHLMLGSCMETLCSSRYSENGDTVHLCLRTLCNLIECPWSQQQLMKNVALAIELLNVLHRLILTRDHHSTQLLCMKVVEKILCAAENVISASESTPKVDTDGSSNAFVGDEGGNDGRIEPGASISFATLEVCLCLLVRQNPKINSSAMNGKSLSTLYRKTQRLPIESYNLIKIAVNILMRIPSLCSSHGALTILPPSLYLIIGVLRECSRIDTEQLVPDRPVGHVSDPAASALQALRILLSRVPNDDTRRNWSIIMRSAFLSIANMADSTDDEKQIDLTVLMLAMAVLATSAPRDVVLGSEMLLNRCIGLLETCLDHQSFVIQYKCLQSLVPIFARKEISSRFIRQLAPMIFAKLKPLLGITNAIESIDDESQLLIIQESIRCIESVLTVADSEKKFTFVNLIVQILLQLLCTDPTNKYRTLTSIAKRMHDFAFTRLNCIGPAYPDHFKKVLNTNTQLKARLEMAVRFSSAIHQQQTTVNVVGVGKSTNVQSIQTPTIKLKVDFGKFNN